MHVSYALNSNWKNDFCGVFYWFYPSWEYFAHTQTLLPLTLIPQILIDWIWFYAVSTIFQPSFNGHHQYYYYLLLPVKDLQIVYLCSVITDIEKWRFFIVLSYHIQMDYTVWSIDVYFIGWKRNISGVNTYRDTRDFRS